MKTMKCVSLIIVGLSLVTATAVRAVLFSDFESPPYTSNADLSGQDGWISISPNGPARVTPDPSVSGLSSALSGSQSAIFQPGGGFHLMTKPWNAASKNIITNSADGFSVSWLVQFSPLPTQYESQYNRGRTDLFVTDNLPGTGSAGTLALLYTNSSVRILASRAGIDTLTPGVYSTNDVYRLTMYLPIVGGVISTYDGYVQDITAGTPQQYLGSFPYAPSLGGTPASIAASGGMMFYPGNAFGYNTILFDDITVVPEPSALALLAVAGLLVRRKLARA